MRIIDDLISTLSYKAPKKEISPGPIQTAVLTRLCDLASTPHRSSVRAMEN